MKVKYNRFHDQLLISGCSSTFVSLYRASSVSSMPLSHVPLADLNSSATLMMTTLGDAMESERLTTRDSDVEDKIIQRYELEDSVNVIDWSAADAWVFAGVSYNGTFFLNHVPSKEKYKILL